MGEGNKEVGEREIIYLSLHCHHQNDFCITMGSDESHFNVSVGSGGQSHKTVSTTTHVSGSVHLYSVSTQHQNLHQALVTTSWVICCILRASSGERGQLSG